MQSSRITAPGWVTRVEPSGTFASLVALRDEFLAATSNAAGLRSYLALEDDVPLVEVQARIAAIEANPSVVAIGQLFELLQALEMQLVLRDSAVSDQPVESASGDYMPKGAW